MPLGGELRDAAEPLGQGGEPVPGVRRGSPAAARWRRARLSSADSRRDATASAPSTCGPPRAGRGLVGDVLVEGVAQLDEVVGEQPQAGVAQVGLHAGGPAGDLGLPAQRA